RNLYRKTRFLPLSLLTYFKNHLLYYLSFSESILSENLFNCFSANDFPPMPKAIAKATATAPKINKNATFTMLCAKFNWSKVINTETIITKYFTISANIPFPVDLLINLAIKLPPIKPNPKIIAADITNGK